MYVENKALKARTFSSLAELMQADAIEDQSKTLARCLKPDHFIPDHIRLKRPPP